MLSLYCVCRDDTHNASQLYELITTSVDRPKVEGRPRLMVRTQSGTEASAVQKK
jgi:hypothetical protein